MSDEPITGTLTGSGLRAVSDLNLHIGGKQYTFAPDRVQPRDTGYLLLLFAALQVQGRVGPLAIEDFVDEHQLWHCFEPRA